MTMKFIPVPAAVAKVGGKLYPEIYRDTHEYIGDVSPKQYRVGDVLLFSNGTHEILEFLGPIVDYNWKYRRLCHQSGADEIRTIGCQAGFCGIFRLRSVANTSTVPAPAVTAAAAKIDDGFNDNCLRCGKRTYTGANKFEHQDGPCQASSGVVRR